MSKYTSNRWKEVVFEVDLEYLKELLKLHNDHSLASDKIEINREMLSNYQLKIADLYNILGNVKKLVPTHPAIRRRSDVVGTSPRRLNGTSPQRLIGTSWRRL